MEILFFIVVSILLGAIIYLANELRKTKIQGKQIEKELAETKEIFKKLEQSNKVSSKPGEMIINKDTLKDTLDEVRKRKFEEDCRKNIEKRNEENERNIILAELWRNKPNDKSKGYDRWYNTESQCPPKSGSCPLSYCVIPAGRSIHCSGCGRDIKSNEPMFNTNNDNASTYTSTTTDIVIDNSNFPSGTPTDFTSMIDNSDYRSDSTSDSNISFGGGNFGGSGAGSSYDDNSSSSDYSSDSGSSYSDTSSND